MSDVVLYGTLGCHLCEEAEAWLNHFFGEIAVKHVDIADDIQLVDQYGLRIPVLSNGMVEADWPFKVAKVDQVLSTQSSSPTMKTGAKLENASTHKSRRTFLIGAHK